MALRYIYHSPICGCPGCRLVEQRDALSWAVRDWIKIACFYGADW